jgi:hypothetical protein
LGEYSKSRECLEKTRDIFHPPSPAEQKK